VDYEVAVQPSTALGLGNWCAAVADLKDAIAALQERIFDEQSKPTSVANDKLRDIAEREGLGVAVMAAWYHGLKFGHILGPEKPDGSPEDPIDPLVPGEGCPYYFVHIPVRKYRNDTNELKRRGIMNKKADPLALIYHEDGLVTMLSFPRPRKDERGNQVPLTDDQVAEILDALSRSDPPSLLPANINNRQIQFKDDAARRAIAAIRGPVYVVNRTPRWDGADAWDRLPGGLQTEQIRDYITGILGKKKECNYCSVQALNPLEVTIHSTPVPTAAEYEAEDRPMHRKLATVRNYQLGFTFAPVGDPGTVCHFLAWDFPHINDVVMSMEPHAASFSDLIKLVQVINEDIKAFCDRKDVPVQEPIYGACNHWAGNSLYHQHYQFFRLTHVPLLEALLEECHGRRVVAKIPAEEPDAVVYELGPEWPVRAFMVKATRPGLDDRVREVADKMAREWRLLSERDDTTSYGNGISIKVNTHNAFVAQQPDGLVAVFIPRHREQLHAKSGELKKENAGVLEMLGHFVIDDREAFKTIKAMERPERADLARSWLAELTPQQDSIDMFRQNIKICLNDAVSAHEGVIDRMCAKAAEISFDKLREQAARKASEIQRDRNLEPAQRGHLYRELLASVLDSGGMIR